MDGHGCGRAWLPGRWGAPRRIAAAGAATAPGMQSGGMPHARGFGRDSALWLAGYVSGKWEDTRPASLLVLLAAWGGGIGAVVGRWFTAGRRRRRRPGDADGGGPWRLWWYELALSHLTKYMLIDISGGQQLFSGNGMPVRDLPLPGKEALARSMVLYLPPERSPPGTRAARHPARPSIRTPPWASTSSPCGAPQTDLWYLSEPWHSTARSNINSVSSSLPL
ncbi:hypothetical protein PCL_04034 [Purpureocillium lilacinum]|uniref:Uncharacterized protein n=1 Tax=Purpureocillium lilacinum TaxID=33203 RepID=A0A2U3EQR6_PURLI|nr:hypothetical protein PCL_04034 [Purpureocillium lilacinum]